MIHTTISTDLLDRSLLRTYCCVAYTTTALGYLHTVSLSFRRSAYTRSESDWWRAIG